MVSIISSSLLLSSITLFAQQEKNTTSQAIIRGTSSLIDQAVEKDLLKSDLKPFPTIDDATYLRRTYINIIGRIPTHQESINFLNSKETNKRAALIDTLVYSPGFESNMFNYWADMLRLKTNHEEYGLGWHIWLNDSVSNNKPYHTMVHEMLSASGHASKNPAVGYYLRDRGMLLDNISNTVQVFLGTQIGCAQCHDHPYEDWTQKEYYQLAAFGANIDYKSESATKKIRETAIFNAAENNIPTPEIVSQPTKDKKFKQQQNKLKKNYQQFIRKTSNDIKSLYQNFNKNEISVNNNKSLKLPKDYQYNDGEPGDQVAPKPLFTEIPDLHQGPNKLENFANWLTHPENPQFTKNIANRLWKHAYGYGLAEPLDNWTDRTKVSHPEALALVENILLQNNYNIRETLRILYHTQLFQRQVSPIEVSRGAVHAFQGPILRRLSALEINDSLLTIQHGNIDENKNHQLKYKWTNYTRSINILVDSKPKVILELDEISDLNESKINSLQAKNRALAIEKTKADADGLSGKSNDINKQRKNIFKQIKKLKQQTAKNISKNLPQTASMTEMKVITDTPRSYRKKIMRASEQPSPFKGDGLLRMFGASDRETSNAAYTDASIPQTLALLNGKSIISVTNDKGNLRQAYSAAKSPTDKLNALFISIYSRYPTLAEKEKYLSVMNDKKQSEAFARAMLNSKRFLFLQ